MQIKISVKQLGKKRPIITQKSIEIKELPSPPLLQHLITAVVQQQVQAFHQKLEELTFETASFDLIYYDAFAPAAQEELWTEAIFKKIFSAMKPKGVLTTYCAKGTVKRALKAAGFMVEGIPGPPGKREMTRAVVG